MAVLSPLVIATKILLPRKSPELLRRPRLIDLLHANIDRRLILISAPAGYGKTSLLTDFAYDTDLPVCWYSLDPFDRDPSVFISHLVATIRRAYPQFGSEVEPLLRNPDFTSNMYPLVASLVNEIHEKIPEYFVLMLDDYHHLDDQDQTNEFLGHFLRHMPESCHVIISTRTLPAVPNLAWLAATGQVFGLGIDELRFTSQDIQKLIRQNLQLDTPDQKAEELAQYSEGWITPILLAAHTTWDGLLEDAARVRDPNIDLYDYLAEQVFSLQPPEIQSFLTASSALDEMSADLCDQLPGLHESAEMLACVQKRNLFVSALGDGDWLRYHHLFRDFLRARLRGESSRFRTVYSEAARIYEERGEQDKALERYLVLQDYDGATRILSTRGRQLFEAGRLESLDGWLSVLPRPILQAHPELSLLWGKVRLSQGDYTTAIKHSQQSLREFTRLGDRTNAGFALVQMSTGSRLQGRYQKAIQQSQQALDLLQEDNEETRPAIAEAHKNMGISLHRQGDLSAGIDELAEALELYGQTDSAFNIASVLHDLGVAYETAGQLDVALEHHEQALGYWRELANPDAWANTLNSIGVLHHLRGDYEQGREFLEAALVKSQEAGSLRRQAYVLASIGDLRRDEGERERALEAYNTAMQSAEQIGDSRLIAYLLDVVGNLHRLMGNLDDAELSLRRALDQAEATRSQSQLGICKTSLGILAYERGELPQALEILSQARDLLIQLSFDRELARANLHLGQALFLSSQRAQGLDHVSQALALIPRAAVLPFLTSEASHMESLLEYTAAKGVERALITEALSRLRARVSRPSLVGSAKATVPSLRIYALGQPQAFLDSEPVTSWITATTKELFFCLLDCPEGLSKERIGAILWPDHSPEKLNGIFRSTMYRLRRALYPEVILFDEGIYSFNREASYWSDVEQFEQLLAEAEALPQAEKRARIGILSRAVELYKGDYLEGFFSDWCLVRRENLRVSYISVLILLGHLYLEAEEYPNALQFCNTVLLNDPYQEAAYRQAIRCYMLMGDRASALRKYQECVDILEEQLGLAPMPETKAIYQQLMS